VFGESISPGATYKSVLAVSSSSAQELVKEALDRYSISRRKAHHYVLCDVIGKFLFRASHRKGVWTEECIRIIGDNEKPLILQSFWKPAEGFLRRFELRKRSQLLAMENIDTTTSGINANARRLLRSKTWSHAGPADAATKDAAEVDPSCLRENHQKHRSKHGRSSSPLSSRLMAPTDACYLLTIVNFDPKQDSLMHTLRGDRVKIGRDAALLEPSDIALSSPDILPQHCMLHRADNTPKRWVLNTFDNAHVTINGCVVKNTIPLHFGDLISIGQHYVFIYKDPDDEQQCVSAVALNLTKQHCKDSLPSGDPVSPPPSNVVRLSGPLDKVQKEVSQQYDDDHSRMKLHFHSQRELELLNKIFNVTARNPSGFVLSPAYLLALSIEHSSAKHGQMQAKSFLLKVASHLQTAVWDCTKRAAGKQNDG
jgi:hypothetical protein